MTCDMFTVVGDQGSAVPCIDNPLRRFCPESVLFFYLTQMPINLRHLKFGCLHALLAAEMRMNPSSLGFTLAVTHQAHHT